MATTDWDFQSNRDQIVQRAFRILGVLAPGETLSGEHSVIGNNVLNDMIKSWQSDHTFLWTLEPTSLTLVAATRTYAAPTDPALIGIDKAYYRVSNVDTEIDVISWRDYEDISEKTATGAPQCIAMDLDVPPLIYVYPVPTSDVAANTIHYLGVSKLKDWESSTATGAFPAKWTDALVYGLAASMVDEFGVPLAERNRIERLALDHYMKAKRGDRSHALAASGLHSAYSSYRGK